VRASFFQKRTSLNPNFVTIALCDSFFGSKTIYYLFNTKVFDVNINIEGKKEMGFIKKFKKKRKEIKNP
jgi:outer membrane protein assembly factor BamE (lipoprotein component of BamABCDE complex)